MQSTDLQRSLPAVFSELVHGAAGHGGVMLNGGDRGLLASLESLTAEQAAYHLGAIRQMHPLARGPAAND